MRHSGIAGHRSASKTATTGIATKDAFRQKDIFMRLPFRAWRHRIANRTHQSADTIPGSMRLARLLFGMIERFASTTSPQIATDQQTTGRSAQERTTRTGRFLTRQETRYATTRKTKRGSTYTTLASDNSKKSSTTSMARIERKNPNSQNAERHDLELICQTPL